MTIKTLVLFLVAAVVLTIGFAAAPAHHCNKCKCCESCIVRERKVS